MPNLPAAWVADPDAVTFAIWALTAMLGVSAAALISVGIWLWNKTDAKIDRVADCLERLTLTTSVEIAKIKTRCRDNHPSCR